MLDAGSFKPTGPYELARARQRAPRWASNFLIVGAQALDAPATRCSSPARRSATSTPA